MDVLYPFRKIRSSIVWRWRCHWASVFARRESFANLAVRPIRRVLVVCYGNIYRSPFVAAYLQQVCGDGLEIRSGGFYARPGRTSPARHVTMSRTRGVDLSRHVSVVVTPADLAWADVIVLMDRHNWQALQLAGAPVDRLVWLGAMDDGPIEIPDPYSLDECATREVLGRLETCAARLASRLAMRRAAGVGHGLSGPAGGGATPVA